MSGDLEDFLRRAAQRRQAKAAQQPQQSAPKRQPPQYTDSRTERVARMPEEEILVAEIVQDDHDAYALQMRRINEAKQEAAKVQAELAKKAKKVKDRTSRSAAIALAPTAHPAENLIRLISQPGGIQQAILLREILDRPAHRWK